MTTPTDRGVNPVVGTILMVGLVVILSAAIGTFILGFGTDLAGDATAGIQITAVEPNGGEGIAVVTALEMNRADRVVVNATSSRTLDTDSGVLVDAGDSVTIRGNDTNSEEIDVTITAIAERNDREVVILDETVTL